MARRGRKPRPFPEGTIEKLRAAMKKARTKSQYRRVLAIWLRARLGFNSLQVAEALDWRANSVRKFQSDYFREGEAVFRGTRRGGDRHPDRLGRAAQRALLDDLGYLRTHHKLRLTVRGIKAEVEGLLGHPIAEQTVYNMISRQGWKPSKLDRKIPPDIRAALAPGGCQTCEPWEARAFLRSVLPMVVFPPPKYYGVVDTQPASGSVGAAVKILGTRLTGAIRVTFNGTAAAFELVSASEITATVPGGAATGPVEVEMPRGTLSSNAPFRVTPDF